MSDDDEKTTEAPLPHSVDRRDFLNTTWKVLGVALIVEAGWTSYDILNPKPAVGFGGTVDAGPVEDFLTEGTVKYFLDGGGRRRRHRPRPIDARGGGRPSGGSGQTALRAC